MREFIELAHTFRNCAIVEDDFELWRDRFDKKLEYLRTTIPKIVCLCGSTRFYEEFVEANYRETMAGNIVLTVGFFMHRPEAAVSGTLHGCTPEEKVMLDQLHKRKIDLCDEVVVLNKGGYIGESTRSEIDYATSQGKMIRYYWRK